MHPAVSHVLKFFGYAHLPEKLQAVSKPFADLAQQVAERSPDNQETTVALRKLLEAKDAAVRAMLSIALTLALCGAAQAQSCATYSRSYTPTYSYAPAVSYGTPTYYAPSKTYKTYSEDYSPVTLRFILALPVANLPSYGAAYADPAAHAAPQAQAPAPLAKAAPNDSLMQQISGQQTQILAALQKLDDRTRAVEQRLEKLERSREPFKAPRPEEQGPPPKEEPVSGDLDKAFAVVDAASCAACHRRGNAAKHGGGFVFTEDDGRLAKLSADQREEVERQITSGKMPRTNTTRAKEASVKALTQATADTLFKALDRQKLAARRKEQAAAE